MAKAIVPGQSQTNPAAEKENSNALLRSCLAIQYVYEPRIMAVLVSRIQADDTDFQNYRIPATGILGKDYSEYDVKELLRSLKHLACCIVPVFGQDGEDRTVQMHTLFSMYRYIPEKGVIELQFVPALKPHYLDLKELLARYGSLYELADTPGVYSQRLCEVLRPLSGQTEVTIPIEDIHRYLDTPVNWRQDFNLFRRRILKPAYRDLVLREGSTLRYQWDPVKKGGDGRAGRRVIALRFVFWKSFAALPLRARAGKMPADPGEEDMKRFCHDCYESFPERCGNFYKTPSEIRGPKKKLCTFCITAGRVAVARDIDERLKKTSAV